MIVFFDALLAHSLTLSLLHYCYLLLLILYIYIALIWQQHSCLNTLIVWLPLLFPPMSSPLSHIVIETFSPKQKPTK